MVDDVVARTETTPVEDPTPHRCRVGRLLTEAEGWQLVAVARTWEGTPYQLAGAASRKGIGGDCSGSTHHIYQEAGFPYPYKTTANFGVYVQQTGRFREVLPDQQPMQAGDILWWPGHMAIYAPFPVGDPRRDTGVVHRGRAMNNDFYTAFNDRTGQPYGPYAIATFRGDRYRVYRYVLLPGEDRC